MKLYIALNNVNFQELFKIEKNEAVGRFAVASEDLKPGDVIFREIPFAYGPKSGNKYTGWFT